MYYKYYNFIRIKSINIKNSILCVLNIIIFSKIKIINITNSIICVMNIIIFIIIQSINIECHNQNFDHFYFNYYYYFIY